MATKRIPVTTLAAAATLLVIAAAAVTGCAQANLGGAVPAGSTSSAGSGSPSVARLCADPEAVRTAVVTRIPGLSQVGPDKPVRVKGPAIRIDDPNRAVALARVICALPLMPRGVLSCPADRGGGFQVLFGPGGRALPPVTVRSSGCEIVVGASVGRSRWIPGAPGFWPDFSRLTGIQDPVHQP